MEISKIFKFILLICTVFNLNACSFIVEGNKYIDSEVMVKSKNFAIDGVDGIKIGQKYEKKLFTQIEEAIDHCFYAKSIKYTDFSLKFVDNILVEIETTKKNIASPLGVFIGDSIESIYQKHKSETPHIEENPYGDENDKVIFYWYKLDNKNLGIKYIITENMVESISVGKKSELPYLEGCN